MAIVELPSQLINQIAAGEIVERPANIIKELVDNSIDAGAKNITITIGNSGKSLIRVRDDGVGIDVEDLNKAALIHNTSKIDINKGLKEISFLGFRGEALASIASVAQLSIESRTENNNNSWLASYNSKGIANIEPSNCAKGTTVIVENVFSKVPARQKFLRSDRSELIAIKTFIRQFALVFPKINFLLRSASDVILQYNSVTNTETRAHQIMGKDFARNSLVIDYSSDDININGFAALPTLSRASKGMQYFFVNNRAVNDKIIHNAVKTAYDDLITTRKYPQIILYINIDPQQIDVNVHPNKNEVRFKNPTKTRAHIIDAILGELKSANTQYRNISQNSHNNFLTSSSKNTKYQPNKNSSLAGYIDEVSVSKKIQSNVVSNFNTGSINKTKEDAAYLDNQMIKNNAAKIKIKPTTESTEDLANNNIDINKTNLNSAHQKSLSLGKPLAQIHKNYLIAETDSGITIIDQHAAHERLVYERLKNAFHNKQHLAKQALLIPIIIELAETQVELLEKNIAECKKFGVVYKRFGKSGIEVTEIPAILSKHSVQEIICNIIDYLGESEHPTLKTINEMLSSIACHNSIRSGRNLSIVEMNALLRQIENTPFSQQCNHGRPTFIRFELKDIEKLFNRR